MNQKCFLWFIALIFCGLFVFSLTWSAEGKAEWRARAVGLHSDLDEPLERRIETGGRVFIVVECGGTFDLYVEDATAPHGRKRVLEGKDLLSLNWLKTHVSPHASLPENVTACQALEGRDSGLVILLHGKQQADAEVTKANRRIISPKNWHDTAELELTYEDGKPVLSWLGGEDSRDFVLSRSAPLTAIRSAIRGNVEGSVMFRMGSRDMRVELPVFLGHYPYIYALDTGHDYYVTLGYRPSGYLYWVNPSPQQPLLTGIDLVAEACRIYTILGVDAQETVGPRVNDVSRDGVHIHAAGYARDTDEMYDLDFIVCRENGKLVTRKEVITWKGKR